MGTSGASRGSGVSIRALREDASALSREEFEDRHGSAFLLLTAAELSMARGPMQTEVRLEIDAPTRADSTASLSLIVFPVRHAGHSAGHLITVGRASDNDVVVPDVSISRFHAFVKQGANGEWLIHDAGSTNGTTVNGHSAPQQGTGSAIEMKSGDNLRIGQVELTFIDAPALISFAMKVER
jgi:hypothetical protein